MRIAQYIQKGYCTYNVVGCHYKIKDMDKKEVREKAIKQIFEETTLKAKGFIYTKKSIYKKEAGCKYSLDFGSAISPNRLEEVNILEVRANISHEGLRKFKKDNLKQDSGFVCGGSIANLFIAGPPWTSFDLGITEESYNVQLEKIKKIVENDVFYFFKEFSEPKNLLNILWQPCFNLRCTIHLFVFLKEDHLLKNLIGMVSVNRKATFNDNNKKFNNRLINGETWLEVYKDVKDGEDSLSLEIANSFFEMGQKL